MNLLRYEFVEGPDNSINGMLRTLVKELRYNRSYVTIEEYKRALPSFHSIESKLQRLDEDIRRPKRNYVQEIIEELDREQDDAVNIIEDLRRATVAMIRTIFGQTFSFDELLFITAKADHYNWLQFNGYKNGDPIDANLLIVREVFRSICNKYSYIFVDLSH